MLRTRVVTLPFGYSTVINDFLQRITAPALSLNMIQVHENITDWLIGSTNHSVSVLLDLTEHCPSSGTDLYENVC